MCQIASSKAHHTVIHSKISIQNIHSNRNTHANWLARMTSRCVSRGITGRLKAHFRYDIFKLPSRSIATTCLSPADHRRSIRQSTFKCDFAFKFNFHAYDLHTWSFCLIRYPFCALKLLNDGLRIHPLQIPMSYSNDSNEVFRMDQHCQFSSKLAWTALWHFETLKLSERVVNIHLACIAGEWSRIVKLWLIHTGTVR